MMTMSGSTLANREAMSPWPKSSKALRTISTFSCDIAREYPARGSAVEVDLALRTRRCSPSTRGRSDMAILMTAEVPGMTQEMVDGMTDQLMGQQKAQPGFVLHANGAIDGGWGVTEVWEAQENWDSWYDGPIKPNLPEGLEPPSTTRGLPGV